MCALKSTGYTVRYTLYTKSFQKREIIKNTPIYYEINENGNSLLARSVLCERERKRKLNLLNFLFSSCNLYICSHYTHAHKKSSWKTGNPKPYDTEEFNCQHVHAVRRFDLCCICRPAWPCHLAQLSVSSGDHVLSM